MVRGLGRRGKKKELLNGDFKGLYLTSYALLFTGAQTQHARCYRCIGQTVLNGILD